MTSLFYTFCLSLTTLMFAHPFFVSICEINHNQETETIEITIKTFSDDLEQTMQNLGHPNLHIGTKKEHESADKILKDYLNESLQIKIADQEIEIEYLGKEVESEVTWIFLEAKSIPTISEIEVRNTFLFEYEDSQTNIIHLFAKDKKKSLLLNSSNEKGTVSF